MNWKSTSKRTAATLPWLGLLGLLASAASAQVPVNEDGYPLVPVEAEVIVDAGTEEPALLSAAQLEELVGPVALYPDDLLAIVLPASTYPLQIVQAARFLEQLEADPTLKPDPEWDDSIVALLNYPEVVRLMNDDLDWTWKLGEAVVAQQSDVIAAIESFRDLAYTAENLKSDEYQTVTRNERVIEIRPAREDVIYVPYYEPERVVVYSPRPVYHYYPTPYPIYYYPYARDYHFASGYFWGLTTAFSIGWASDYLHVHHHSYYGHPYYGHSYHGHHYRRPPIHVYNHYYVNNHRHRPRNRHRHGDYWRPRHRGGARPGRHVARNGYYRDGQRHRPHAGNRSAGNRNQRDDRAADRRGGATSRNSSPRRAIANRPGNAQRNATQLRNRGVTPRAAAGRSSDRERNRSNRNSRERPAVAFRPRSDAGRTSSGRQRQERGRSQPPRRSAPRSSVSRRAPAAARSAARESATMPRVAPRQGARSKPSQRSVQRRTPGVDASRGNRSSAVSSFRGSSRGPNRQTRARVSAPPQRNTVRSHPRRSSARSVAHASRRPAPPPSQRRYTAPSRPVAKRSGSGRSSSSKHSSPRRGGTSAQLPRHRDRRR